ncbi:MAG: precorrin-3B C(17)-methyltransferase [Oligoflexia bacterium]|nr:precorrin-3B C(17)-methyltransferase [Oligoflexia bacterium]
MEKFYGKINIIGIGPGALETMSGQSIAALTRSHTIVGYKRYLDLVRKNLPELPQERFCDRGSNMMAEVERAKECVFLARTTKQEVAIVSSGDAGVYGMASLIFEVLRETKVQAEVAVEVIPGITAANSAASLVGAPLGHDYANISLSDLLTPKEVILKRVEMATAADFVLVFYNPASKKRRSLLVEAIAIIKKYREMETPVAIVSNAYRESEESSLLTDLKQLAEHYHLIDMQTLVIVGASTTYRFEQFMVTPRGYHKKYELHEEEGDGSHL